MRLVASLRLLFATAFCAMAFGQSVETIALRAKMVTANEVPPITDFAASGDGTFFVHVVRDQSGKITSGSVDFNVGYTFPGNVTITGLHFHKGAAGVNGPVVINTGISATNPVNTTTTTGTVSRQVQVTSAADIDTVTQLLADPSQFYANLHTSVYPGGVFRAQLTRAEITVFLGQMSPANEVPAIPDVTANGVAAAVVVSTRNASGVVDGGQVMLMSSYTGFADGTQFTGFHIHNGAAGTNGPVVLDSGIKASAAVTVPAGGVGTLSYPIEVSTDAQLAALRGLLANPNGFYANLHTTTFPGGVIRAQMRPVDMATFQVTLSPANEVPPITGVTATAPARFDLYTIRNSDGTAAAGLSIFDVNPRMGATTTFTGLHIHNGAAGTNGPVTIDSGISATNNVVVEGGTGNIYRFSIIARDPALSAANSVLNNPENHYMNLHTTTNPGGIVRSQLATAVTGLPSITFVGTATGDPRPTQFAPGQLITIVGTNLAKVSGGGGFNLSGLPTSINGTKLTIGGKTAPILAVSGGQVVAQIPFDVPVGAAPLLLTGSNGSAASRDLNIVAYAPSLFFVANNAGVIAKNSDFSLVTASNPVGAGEYIVVYATGLGQTKPAGSTGAFVGGAPFAFTDPVTATIGGAPAEVVYSILTPGYAGLYQVALRVPSGLPTGLVPVQLTIGGVPSNSVTLAVK